ncbi:LOW QUALITY PROTEIN: spindle assembly abnormal protein 6 homolog [Achroia grisella]|uniref:LOW QUALITY PROTEIN: spindle assembly abnormal protein 6 homolog n=1 Tax=Achroia grisella TaxID=688607 RepID=UPI0027D2A8E2|nr:LOW QUALITY PROTEIN: spindle assembly abnormal protein 6 homolog [Achroia grisella]
MASRNIHTGKYYVNFKRGFEDYKKDITVTIDKVFSNDSLKISLADDNDPTFLCILNITPCDYEDLKKQQGLLIDFDNFSSQLVRLLQQCASNNMFLIMQQTNPVQYYFEIIEHNEFKRLVHLSLRTGPATDADIKQHMADTITNLKKMLATVKSSAASSDAIWNDKCLNLERKIQDLTHVVSKMEEDKHKLVAEYQDELKHEKEKLTQERSQWQKTTENTSKVQLASFQENINRKDRQIDELNVLSRQLKENIAQLENQISDKSQRLMMLENEVQKTHIEVATLKAKNTTLEREIAEKEKQFNQVNTRCISLEQFAKDNSDMIKDLNKSIQSMKKEKISLEERLAISESLVNKNNNAAHSASEQLMKANQIISKQNAELIEIREKLLCRTAIALEQEKVIESSNKEINDLKSTVFMEIQKTNKNMDKRSFNEWRYVYITCEDNEKALKDRDETIKNNNMVIQWLHRKVEGCDSGNVLENTQKYGVQSVTNSTPYFLPSNINKTNSQNVSDQSIDFYATSKLSNVEDSPGPLQDSHTPKLGLDPKYLRPAGNNNRLKSVNEDSKTPKPSEAERKSGKENKTNILPKVDYREKKTGRSTYRATPVSAYFH